MAEAAADGDESDEQFHKYPLGTLVLLSQEREGEVKWIGELPGDAYKDCKVYGLELTDGQSMGDCSGDYEGTTYFECEEGRGVFVKEHYIRRALNDRDFKKARRKSRLSMQGIKEAQELASQESKKDDSGPIKGALPPSLDMSSLTVKPNLTGLNADGTPMTPFQMKFEEQMSKYTYDELLGIVPFTLVGRGTVGVDEMQELLDNSKVYFGLLQIQVGSGQFARYKNIFIHFNGEEHRKPLQRAQANKKITIAKDIFGPCHAPLTVQNRENMTVDWVFNQLKHIFVADDLGGETAKFSDLNSVKADYTQRMAEARERAEFERARMERERQKMIELAKQKREEMERLRREEMERCEAEVRAKREEEIRAQRAKEMEAKIAEQRAKAEAERARMEKERMEEEIRRQKLEEAARIAAEAAAKELAAEKERAEKEAAEKAAAEAAAAAQKGKKKETTPEKEG